jgi:hypothetical protein
MMKYYEQLDLILILFVAIFFFNVQQGRDCAKAGCSRKGGISADR